MGIQMNFIKKNIIFALLVITSITTCLPTDLSASTKIRAALDIGSGATKLRVAEVDLENNRIVKVLESKSFTTPYQEKLSKSSDGLFDEEVMKIGLNALK